MSRRPLKQAAAKANKNNVPERAADPAKQSSRQLRPRTAEEIANEQTAEQLALRIWAAMVGPEGPERHVGPHGRVDPIALAR